MGEWKNDKRHGKGKYIIKADNIKEGLWEEDRRVKWIGELDDTQ